MADVTDPVLVRRAQLARLAKVGKRVGYLALLAAIVAFGTGMASGLPSWSVTVVFAAFVVATVFLVPAIILSFAVQKAQREDPAAQSAHSGRPHPLISTGEDKRKGRTRSS